MSKTQLRPGPLSAEWRALMRAKLTALFPIAEQLEATDVIEAARALDAVLSVPGPVDSATLLPLLETFDTRVARLFEARANETTGAERAKMEAGARAANEEAMWKRELLEDADPD